MLGLTQHEIADMIATTRTGNATINTLREAEAEAVWSIINTNDDFLIELAIDGKRFREGGIKTIWSWYEISPRYFESFITILDSLAGVSGIALIFKTVAIQMLEEGSSIDEVTEFLSGSKKNKGRSFDAVHVMKANKLKLETNEIMKDIDPIELEDKIRYSAVDVYSLVTDNLDMDSLKMARRNMLKLRGKLSGEDTL